MERREERCDCCSSLAVVVARADMVVVVVVLLAGSRMMKAECFDWSELQPKVSTTTLTLTFLTLFGTVPNTFYLFFFRSFDLIPYFFFFFFENIYHDTRENIYPATLLRTVLAMHYAYHYHSRIQSKQENLDRLDPASIGDFISRHMARTLTSFYDSVSCGSYKLYVVSFF
jgi:hypothetical protein